MLVWNTCFLHFYRIHTYEMNIWQRNKNSATNTLKHIVTVTIFATVNGFFFFFSVFLIIFFRWYFISCAVSFLLLFLSIKMINFFLVIEIEFFHRFAFLFSIFLSYYNVSRIKIDEKLREKWLQCTFLILRKSIFFRFCNIRKMISHCCSVAHLQVEIKIFFLCRFFIFFYFACSSHTEINHMCVRLCVLYYFLLWLLLFILCWCELLC